MRARGRAILLTVAATLAAGALPAAAPAAPATEMGYQRWTGTAFAGGSYDPAALAVSGGTLVLGPAPAAGSDATGRAGQVGTWTSGWVSPGFAFDQVVASWNAATPLGTWIEVRLQARDATHDTKWYVLGVWKEDDAGWGRTSVGGQGDKDGTVAIDTFVAAKKPFSAYRLQARLFRETATGSPSIRLLGAIASVDAAAAKGIPSATAMTSTVDLAVPTYSQEVHAGEYPQYDGGGEAWCSPTSTQMVVEFWGRYPTAAQLAWVDPSYADPSVDHAARYTYDVHYQGAGNWPFNTAYAATYAGLRGEVTQLRSLAEAERFIRAGIPLVASIAVGSHQLDGFLFKGTNGHLVVIRGFTGSGQPIVNDPAAVTNASVPRVYDRAEFERAWLAGSGGIVYVIRPEATALPPTMGGRPANW